MGFGRYRFRRSFGQVKAQFRGARPKFYPLFTGLLDTHAGAAAAYSLRRLSKIASSVVRVRRASDNAEKDFTADNITDGAMVNWVNGQIVPPLDIRELDANGERTGDLVEAAAAYSLRNLSESYTGSVVEVRRSSDGEEDSFTASDVADGTLEDWVTEEQVGWNVQPTWDVNTGDGVINSQSSTATTSTLSLTTTTGESSVRQSSKPSHIVASAGDRVEINLDVSGLDSNMRIRLSPTGSNVTSLNLFNISNGSNQTLSGTLSQDAGYVRFLDIEATSGATLTINSIKVIGKSGFVSKWYDQSGNANHATQGTDASQPKIVDGGSLVSGGLDFDGADDGLFTSSNLTDTLQSATIFALTQDNTTSGTASMVRIRPNGALGTLDGLVWEKVTNATYGANTLFEGANGAVSATVEGQGIRTTSKNLNTLVYQQSQILAYENGALDETLTTVGSGSLPVGDVTLVDQLWIGQNFDDNARPFNGTMSEVIIYFTDQSDNRTAIEANIGETYSIDLPSGVDTGYDQVDGFVETWYDQSGNGNDAVQQVSGSQPKIVDAGVLVSGGLDFDGVDDALKTADYAVNLEANNASVFAVTNATSPNHVLTEADQATYSSNFILGRNDETLWVNAETFGASYPTTSASTGFDFDGTNFQAYINGVASGASGTATVNPSVNGGTFIGSQARDTGSTSHYEGTIAEIICYKSDQSANRPAIETDINDHYDIYA